MEPEEQGRADKRRAFAELARDAERKLFRFACRITGSTEDAEDVVQEALLKAYAHLSEFQGNSTLDTWLCRIILNEAYRRSRAERRHRPLDAPAADGATRLARETADPGDSPEHAVSEEELLRTLREAVRNLPGPYRSVFTQCVLEGCSMEEVAAREALPAHVVRQRLIRARVRLRETLVPCSRSCTQFSSGCLLRPCARALGARPGK